MATSAPKATPEAGLRKRQQIASSNKAMFIWVAGASVLVAFSLVISIFIVKQIIFTERILMEKGKTTQTLRDNINTADDLDKSVKELRANEKLTSARTISSDNNLDVVIDAMPYDADAEAMGASLQRSLFADTSIESLTVNSPDDETISSSSIDTSLIETYGDALPITFSFKAVGTSDQLKTLFDLQ